MNLKKSIPILIIIFTGLFIGCKEDRKDSARTNIIYNNSGSLVSFHIDSNENYLILNRSNLAHFNYTEDLNLNVYGPGIRNLGSENNSFAIEITPREEDLKNGRLPITIALNKNGTIEKVDYSVKVKKN